MEDQTIDQKIVEEVEEVEEVEASEPTDDINELKARIQKLEEKSIAHRERTRLLRQELEKSKKAATPKEAPSQPDGLDETQLDYLDVKGISEAEDIAIIERHVKRTGETVRQALKDDYVQAKLKANLDKRAVQDATPSGTRRSGSQTDSFEAALAKFEATGELPKDFELRAKVVNAKVERESSSVPPWLRRK